MSATTGAASRGPVRRRVRLDPGGDLGRPRRRTPWATPFSRHCVQKAWWDAYGATAHDQTLVVADEAGPGRRSSASCR
jgi:hypothetical protein